MPETARCLLLGEEKQYTDCPPQIASRYGIDLVHTLKLKERAKSSKILSALSEITPFKTSFGVTFAMASFMQF